MNSKELVADKVTSTTAVRRIRRVIKFQMILTLTTW
jgi:hypothetical protein